MSIYENKKIHLRIYGAASLNPGDEFNSVSFNMDGVDAAEMVLSVVRQFNLDDGEFCAKLEKKIENYYDGI